MTTTHTCSIIRTVKGDTHKQEIFNGQKITYRGTVYWANMVTAEIFAHRIGTEISGCITGYKVADITENFDIVKA